MIQSCYRRINHGGHKDICVKVVRSDDIWFGLEEDNSLVIFVSGCNLWRRDYQMNQGEKLHMV